MSERLYIAMRADLGMGRGKEIAQAIHAYRFLGLASRGVDMAVICVRADDEDHLCRLVAEALLLGHSVSPAIDAGRTQVAPGTQTCAAIGPIIGRPGLLLASARLY